VPAGPLREVWRTTVPGDTNNMILCDQGSQSVFVSDGWNVAYGALRLHRLDLTTGQHRAELRTRSQSVSGLAMDRGKLWVATDSRLFELAARDLSIIRGYEKGLMAYTRQLIPVSSLLVTADWLRPSIGVFDPDTGKTSRVKLGGQPLLCKFHDVVRAVAGFDGGLWNVDPERRRLTDLQPTPPVFAITAGHDLWAVLAGKPEGGQGAPPVWMRRGTDVLTKLTGPPQEARVGGPCARLFADDRLEVIWCLVNRGAHLQAVSQATSALLATYAPEPEGVRVSFCHVDPGAGLAFALEAHRITDHGYVRSSTSTLTCYALPAAFS
jgi:hypothetical protein